MTSSALSVNELTEKSSLPHGARERRISTSHQLFLPRMAHAFPEARTAYSSFGHMTATPEKSQSVALLMTPRRREQVVTNKRDTLYGEFRPLVLRLIRKYGDDAEARKDLEGEIYCVFNDLLEAFDPKRGVPLKAYLVHQLTTSVYTLARRNWRHDKREISLELREDVTGEMDPSKQWDDAIAMQKVRDMLPEAISQLPLRQRQVVVWRYFEHRSFEEIAEALGGVQVATTRSLLRHGMNTLRRNFKKANVSIDE